MPWQLSCRGMCKFVTWLDHCIQNQNIKKSYKIWILSSWTISETGPRWKLFGDDGSFSAPQEYMLAPVAIDLSDAEAAIFWKD